MKKLLFALCIGTVVGVGGKLYAGEWGPESNLVPTGWNHTTVFSSAVIYNQGGTIYRVQCSSGVDALNEFFQLFELNIATPAGGFAYASINNSSQAVTSPYIFKSTGTFSGIGGTTANILDFVPFGVRTSSTAYFYYGNMVNQGERPCTVFWMK